MERIRKIIKSRDISNYYVADFETTTLQSKYFQKHKRGALIAWLCEKVGNTEETFQGTTFESFERFLLSFKDPAVIFFHNLSKFDGYVIIAYALKRWKCNLKMDYKSKFEYSYQKVLGGLLTITIKTPHTIIVLQDSWRLLSLGVHALGKTLGYPKLETNYHIDPVEKWENLPEDFREYLKRDVDIVNISLQNFAANIKKLNLKYNANLNPFAITASNLSRSIITFFDKNNDFKITKEEQENAYPFTRGGFTNFNHNYILKKVKCDLVMYDAKSHYPSIMYSKILPAGEPEYYHDTNEFYELFVKDKVPNYEIIFVHVEGVIKKSTCGWGVIPVSGELDNYIYEPKETYKPFHFYGLLAEWKACLKFYEFHEWYFVKIPYWATGQRILQKPIEDLYYLKEHEKNNMAYKIILNSIYGSCAMKHTYPTEIFFKKGENPLIEFKKWKKTWLYLSKKEENFYYHNYVCYEYEEDAEDDKECWNKWIAAAITSYGRQILIDLIARDPDNVLYGDTDSLIIKKGAKIFQEHELGKELTKWDIDKDNITHAKILGPKRYFLFQDKNLVKNSFAGVSKKYWENKSEEEIDSYFASDYILLENAQMRRIKKSEYDYFPFLEEIDYIDKITMRRKENERKD